MRKALLLFALGIFLLGCLSRTSGLAVGNSPQAQNFSQAQKNFEVGEVKISSPAFENGAQIPEEYTCKGENVNPPLEFLSVPNGAKSLALIVDDPDAPSGDWVHWVVFNIEPQTEKIEENSAPDGVLGKNDFGKNEYGGPCPPSGTHRYLFKLYALDEKLPLLEGASKAEVESAMGGHIIAKAELIGTASK